MSFCSSFKPHPAVSNSSASILIFNIYLLMDRFPFFRSCNSSLTWMALALDFEANEFSNMVRASLAVSKQDICFIISFFLCMTLANLFHILKTKLFSPLAHCVIVVVHTEQTVLIQGYFVSLISIVSQ